MLKWFNKSDVSFVLKTIRFYYKNKKLSERERRKFENIVQKLIQDESEDIYIGLIESIERAKETSELKNIDIH
tara:strand:+ start:6727 stop:6945 length:219 start_codon:yes stop_codon:yes gene_type:complete